MTWNNGTSGLMTYLSAGEGRLAIVLLGNHRVSKARWNSSGLAVELFCDASWQTYAAIDDLIVKWKQQPITGGVS